MAWYSASQVHDADPSSKVNLTDFGRRVRTWRFLNLLFFLDESQILNQEEGKGDNMLDVTSGVV